MSTLVTGTSGHLGRMIVDALLERGVAPSAIVAGARTPSRIADLADRGIRTAHLDYGSPATIRAALVGVDSAVLVSGSEPGTRVTSHQNVIAASREAGVAKLVYTSAPKATTFDWALGADHRATEETLVASEVPYVIVRNNWYTENYVAAVVGAAETGVLAASAGAGRVASASRRDYAEGAAVVASEDGHLGRTYEFAGDTSWSFDDLAIAASTILDRDVTYTPLTTDEHTSALEGAGLDPALAAFIAGIDAGIGRGVLADASDDLSKIIGRPTTPLVDGLRPAVEVARAAA